MFHLRFVETTGALPTAAAVILGSAALALSAKIQIPLWPVPVTMQSLAVLLIAAAAGSRLGAAIVLAYLAEGAAGMPVFAGASTGPEVLVGPTGGYVLGFLLAACGVGWLSERGWCSSLRTSLPLMLIGHVVILFPGVLWLGHFVGAERAIGAGLTPFLVGTAVKSVAGASLIAVTRPWSRRGPSCGSEPSWTDKEG